MSAAAPPLLDRFVLGPYSMCVSNIQLSKPKLCSYRVCRIFFLHKKSAKMSELPRMSVTMDYLLSVGKEFGFAAGEGL